MTPKMEVANPAFDSRRVADESCSPHHRMLFDSVNTAVNCDGNISLAASQDAL